jgi:hypothetical protein
VANSGRFARTLGALLAGASAFAAFLAWSDWLWQTTGKTHRLTPEDLVDALFDYLTNQCALPREAVRQLLKTMWAVAPMPALLACGVAPAGRAAASPTQLALRQAQHGRSGGERV